MVSNRTPYPPPPPKHCNVYIYKVYLFTQGRGESWTREKGWGATGRVQILKLGFKYRLDWMCARNWLSPFNKHLPQSPFTCQFFRWRHFCIDFYESYLSTVILYSLICTMQSFLSRFRRITTAFNFPWNFNSFFTVTNIIYLRLLYKVCHGRHIVPFQDKSCTVCTVNILCSE